MKQKKQKKMREGKKEERKKRGGRKKISIFPLSFSALAAVVNVTEPRPKQGTA